MKKLLLSSLVICAGIFNTQAQTCTPGANFADSTYGAWPDTVQNFPAGLTNVFYSTDLNFKVPATVIDALDPSGQFVGSPIQSFTVTGVDGLPAGLNYACNISNCTFNGGANGCANLYGTTATAGTYSLTINIDATVLITLVPGFPPTPVTQGTTFDGYKVVIGVAGNIEQVIAPVTVSPNPAMNELNINGISPSMKASTISITNIEGKVVASKSVSSSAAQSFDLSSMKAGIYFVNVYHTSGVETVKFIKE